MSHAEGIGNCPTPGDFAEIGIDIRTADAAGRYFDQGLIRPNRRLFNFQDFHPLWLL
jgi:hypothetical protein